MGRRVILFFSILFLRCSTWNMSNADENHSYLTFPQNRRACASAKVKYFFECYPIVCDRFANQGHSLFLGAGAPVQKRSGFPKVLPAPIIQCLTELVKSFL